MNAKPEASLAVTLPLLQRELKEANLDLSIGGKALPTVVQQRHERVGEGRQTSSRAGPPSERCP